MRWIVMIPVCLALAACSKSKPGAKGSVRVFGTERSVASCSASKLTSEGRRGHDVTFKLADGSRLSVARFASDDLDLALYLAGADTGSTLTCSSIEPALDCQDRERGASCKGKLSFKCQLAQVEERGPDSQKDATVSGKISFDCRTSTR